MQFKRALTHLPFEETNKITFGWGEHERPGNIVPSNGLAKFHGLYIFAFDNLPVSRQSHMSCATYRAGYCFKDDNELK